MQALVSTFQRTGCVRSGYDTAAVPEKHEFVAAQQFHILNTSYFTYLFLYTHKVD